MKEKKLSENVLKIKVLTYILLFVFLYGVTNVHIYYTNLLPFGVGLIFALLYMKYNGYYLSIIYLLAYVLSGMRLINIIEGINVCAVLIIIQFLLNKNKLKLSKWKIFVMALISQMVFIMNKLGSGKENLALFISIVVSMLFLYTCICFFDGVLRRGISSKLTIDEKICGCVMLIIFMMGMGYTNISIINIGMIFASIIILIVTHLFSISSGVLISSLIGISYSILTTNYLYISLFVVLALCSIVFQKTYRIFSCLSIVLGYLGFTLLFNSGIAWGEIISLAIGCVLFLFVPKKILGDIKSLLTCENKIVITDMLDGIKNQVIKRVESLSAIFGEMEAVYKDMVRGSLPDNIAKDMLKEELISCVCKDCPNYEMCFRRSGNFSDNSFETLVEVGYEKNKILLIDLPQYLTTNCIKINDIIDTLNSLLSSYKEYTSAINNLDTSRVIIADQLSGVSSLLKSLSEEVDVNIKNKNRLGQRIIEELEYKGIVCLECYVYEKNSDSVNVSIIVRNNNQYDNIVKKIVTKILRIKVDIVEKKSSVIEGFDVVVLENSPKYNMVYGVSTVNKLNKKVSGDSHSIIQIDNGKYLVSICDGMGSGDRANKISKLTISLIEKFYRARFDSDIILNSVNKLLSLSEEENYSTIDLCIVDGKKNYYDFIKLGGCNSFLMRDSGDVDIIHSSGLPVGIIEDIRPHITRRMINAGDMIVLVSDGIVDSMGDELESFLKFNDCINPQTLADKILSRALKNTGNVSQDDMTVVVLRLIENC